MLSSLWIHSLAIVVYLTYLGAIAFQEQVQTYVHLRWTLLSSPQEAVHRFCQQNISDEKPKFCHVVLQWRSQDTWQSPCSQGVKGTRESFAPRYYRLSSHCDILGLFKIRGNQEVFR